MCALCGLMKRGFENVLYEKLWKNAKEECDMKEKQYKCFVEIVKLVCIMRCPRVCFSILTL
jgi:hypothetical protein